MELGSLIGFGQLGVYFGLVYLFVHKYGSHLSKTDKWTAIWFGFDGLCHLLFEGVYVLFTFIGPIKKLNAYIVEPWNEYAKSDSRWSEFDSTVLSLEILTVFVAGPLALYICWAILNNSKWRHPLQIVICTMELYGGWMTFGPEWLIGSPKLVTNNFTYLWLYLTIPNGAWVVIPFYLLWDSFQAFFEVLNGKKRTPKSPKSPKSVPSAPAMPVPAKEAASAPTSPYAASPIKRKHVAAATPAGAKSPKGRATKKNA